MNSLLSLASFSTLNAELNGFQVNILYTLINMMIVPSTVLPTTTACDNPSLWLPLSCGEKQKCQPLLEPGVISRAIRQGRTLHWHSSLVGEEDKWSSSQLQCIRWDMHLHLALNKICGTTTEKLHQETVSRGEKNGISGKVRWDVTVQCVIYRHRVKKTM